MELQPPRCLASIWEESFPDHGSNQQEEEEEGTLAAGQTLPAAETEGGKAGVCAIGTDGLTAQSWLTVMLSGKFISSLPFSSFPSLQAKREVQIGDAI